MNSKLVNFFCFSVMLFCFNFGAIAQQNNDTDSDSVNTHSYVDSANGTIEEKADTVIGKTSFESSKDSILARKRGPEFGYISYLDSLLKSRKNSLRIDTVSFSNKANNRKRVSGNESSDTAIGFLNSFPVKIFFWSLALIFIGIILYKLFFSGGIFTKGSSGNAKKPAPEEPNELDEFEAYNLLIREAEAKNDFNLAARYLYLQSLKKLSETGLILFAPDKTNNIYIAELSGRSYQSEFADLTLNYEYVWYGRFAIDKNYYGLLKEKFISFNNKI